MATRTAPARPAGLRAVLFAALVGVIVAFSLTHNPFFQICTGPLVALCGPFLGGMAAAGRARTGPAEAAFYALCIAGVTVAPLVMRGSGWSSTARSSSAHSRSPAPKRR